MIDNAYPKLSAWKDTLSAKAIEMATMLNSVAMEERYERSEAGLLDGEIILELWHGVVCLRFSIGDRITYIHEDGATVLSLEEAEGLIRRVMREIVKR